MSELKLEQNCAKQAAYEIREAAERRQQQLGEALTVAQARCGELEEAAAGAQRAAEAAQRAAGKLERQLAEVQAEHAALQEAHEKVRGRARLDVPRHWRRALLCRACMLSVGLQLEFWIAVARPMRPSPSSAPPGAALPLAPAHSCKPSTA